MRKNCLYERSLGKWVQYDEATYEALRQDRVYKCCRMRRQKVCLCPKNEQWRCDGMCEGCPYQKEMEKSFNKEIKGTNGLTLGDILTDGIDQEEVFVGKIYYRDILKKLDEVMPEARKIGLMRLEGKSDRQIADELCIIISVISVGITRFSCIFSNAL